MTFAKRLLYSFFFVFFSSDGNYWEYDADYLFVFLSTNWEFLSFEELFSLDCVSEPSDLRWYFYFCYSKIPCPTGLLRNGEGIGWTIAWQISADSYPRNTWRRDEDASRKLKSSKWLFVIWNTFRDFVKVSTIKQMKYTMYTSNVWSWKFICKNNLILVKMIFYKFVEQIPSIHQRRRFILIPKTVSTAFLIPRHRHPQRNTTGLDSRSAWAKLCIFSLTSKDSTPVIPYAYNW